MQIGRQDLMKARHARIGHGTAKVTFGNARQFTSVVYLLSCGRVLEECKQSYSAMSEEFVDADSTPPDGGKGAEQSAMHPALTAAARARQRVESCTASPRSLSLAMVDSCWMSSPTPSLHYETGSPGSGSCH